MKRNPSTQVAMKSLFSTYSKRMYLKGIAVMLFLLSFASVSSAFHESIPSIIPSIDGQIQENEYQNHYRDTKINMDVYWTLYKENIYLALRSHAKGWMGIGIDPTGSLMQGADIILGYVKDGKLFIQDNFANSAVNRAPDTVLGGKNDILESAGSESDKGTVIEFKRKLNTTDSFDRALTDNEYKVLLAYSESDDLTSYHPVKSTAFINFFSGNVRNEDTDDVGKEGSIVKTQNPATDSIPAEKDRYQSFLTMLTGVISIAGITIALLIIPERGRSK